MGAFGGLILTNKGRNLQSKAQTGVTLKYTRIAMGDGSLGSTPILALNGLINQKKSLSITKLKVQSGGRATVGAVWSNNDITEGFYFRELGVFAQDPDLGEILYCYGNAGALAEYIPPGGGEDILERSLDITTLVGNAANVTAIIDSSLVYATKPDLDALEERMDSNIVKFGQSITNLDERVTQHLAEDATLTMRGHTQLQTAIDESETKSATPRAIYNHANDYVKHPAVVTTTNSGNAYSVTLSPAPTAYVNGMGLVVTVNAASTGAVSIKANELAVVPVKKANGTAVTNFKVNGVYTLRYNAVAAAFILQGEGGSGNAQPSDVFVGKTFTNDEGEFVGTNNYKSGITMFEKDLTLLQSVGSKVSQVSGAVGTSGAVATDNNGDIYVIAITTAGALRITKYNSNLQLIYAKDIQSWWQFNSGAVLDVKVDSNNNLYISSAITASNVYTNFVNKVSSVGNLVLEKTNMNLTQSSLVNNEIVYVDANYRAQLLDLNLAQKASLGFAELTTIKSITADANNYYVFGAPFNAEPGRAIYSLYCYAKANLSAKKWKYAVDITNSNSHHVKGLHVKDGKVYYPYTYSAVMVVNSVDGTHIKTIGASGDSLKVTYSKDYILSITGNSDGKTYYTVNDYYNFVVQLPPINTIVNNALDGAVSGDYLFIVSGDNILYKVAIHKLYQLP